MTLHAHLSTGCTTVCRCWAITRRDGVVQGFTDHDRDLAFDGIAFTAGSGLNASALAQSTGLAVDNSEAVGALSDGAIREDDLRAGRYDSAEVRLWLVNWANVDERDVLFRGTIGEVTQTGGQFRAELRGLTEALNRPFRRVFQSDCTATLGDRRCKVDLGSAAFSAASWVVAVPDPDTILIGGGGYAEGWFDHGRVIFDTGAAQGLSVPIKRDRITPAGRQIDLWHSPGALPAPGDQIRLEAGCDRTAATCQSKFGNFLNFRGFPDIPGDDWITAHPSRTDRRDGGSRKRP